MEHVNLLAMRFVLNDDNERRRRNDLVMTISPDRTTDARPVYRIVDFLNSVDEEGAGGDGHQKGPYRTRHPRHNPIVHGHALEFTQTRPTIHPSLSLSLFYFRFFSVCRLFVRYLFTLSSDAKKTTKLRHTTNDTQRE